MLCYCGRRLLFLPLAIKPDKQTFILIQIMKPQWETRV